MENTISIKLGKTVKTFRIERTICGIVLTDLETYGIIFEMDQRRCGTWVTSSAVREISFFEEELKEIAIKTVKKYKI